MSSLINNGGRRIWIWMWILYTRNWYDEVIKKWDKVFVTKVIGSPCKLHFIFCRQVEQVQPVFLYSKLFVNMFLLLSPSTHLPIFFFVFFSLRNKLVNSLLMNQSSWMRSMLNVRWKVQDESIKLWTSKCMELISR